jgi:Protein of unknown function (DUF2892)
MTCNVGGIERPIRMAVGLVAIIIGIVAGLSTAKSGAALAVGVVLLLTGAVGFCPLFTLLGISTCTPASGVKK